MAIGRLGTLGRVTGVSSLWRTAPRDRTDQPTFLNAVAAIENERWIADPEALLAELKGIERACGRVDRGRYGPRELDLDILLFSSMPGASCEVLEHWPAHQPSRSSPSAHAFRLFRCSVIGAQTRLNPPLAQPLNRVLASRPAQQVPRRCYIRRGNAAQLQNQFAAA